MISAASIASWPAACATRQLTLRLDDRQLALSDVEGTDLFIWTVDDLDWEDGQSIAVRLTRKVPDAVAPTGPGMSVANARVREAEGAVLSFRVTLDAPQTSTVSVRYATSDVTARAGEDYESVSGALRFAPGETVKTVAVPVINDAHDEGAETLTLALSRPFGAQLTVARGRGTIVNTGPIPQAWLARFGRAAAEHVLQGVEERLTGRGDVHAHRHREAQQCRPAGVAGGRPRSDRRPAADPSARTPALVLEGRPATGLGRITCGLHQTLAQRRVREP